MNRRIRDLGIPNATLREMVRLVRAAGRVLEPASNRRPREMIATAHRQRRAEQNSAYRPTLLIFSTCRRDTHLATQFEVIPVRRAGTKRPVVATQQGIRVRANEKEGLELCVFGARGAPMRAAGGARKEGFGEISQGKIKTGSDAGYNKSNRTAVHSDEDWGVCHMITRIISLVLSVGLFLSIGGATRASIIIDHQPHPYGGGASDTLFPYPITQPYSQRVADDFVWPTAEPVTGINFWGFYNADNPPATETMRIRFYAARPVDGLPGDVLKEVSIQNPSRVWTGGWIGDGIIPREYFYQVSLTSPVAFDAGVKYWLEIVQIGDITTTFRWEDSVSAYNGVAFVNPTVVDWRYTLPGGPADTAFQLISPEPTSLAMLALGLVITTWRRRSGKRGA